MPGKRGRWRGWLWGFGIYALVVAFSGDSLDVDLDLGAVQYPDYPRSYDTGEHVWQQELDAGVWCSSPVVADGKVYTSTERQTLWVLKAGREKEVLARCRVRSMAITPVYQNGILYLPTQRRLLAVQIK